MVMVRVDASVMAVSAPHGKGKKEVLTMISTNDRETCILGQAAGTNAQ